MSKFSIIDIDSNIWKNKLDLVEEKNKDIFYSQNFARLAQKTLCKKFKVISFLAEDEKDFILCPAVVRSFNFKEKKFNDLTSLYSHGGPITNNRNNNKLLIFFCDELVKYCKDNKIINYLIRYHPLIHRQIKNKSIKNIKTGEFVYVDLSKLNVNIISDSFARRHKRSLSKAKKNQVEILISNDRDYIEDFYNLYFRELKLKNAESFYFFDKNFFYELKNFLEGYQFFYAVYNNRIISCELVLYNNYYCHSYLGATNSDYKEICANHLLKDSILSFFKHKNLKYYLIGGGSEGVMNYKNGFKNVKNLHNYIGIIDLEIDFNKYLKNEISKNLNIYDFNRIQFYENIL
jgi:hypothetical protein